MFDKFIKLAEYYDRIGNYIQSDKITRIAAQHSDMARRKVKDVADVLDDTDMGVYDDIPKKKVEEQEWNQIEHMRPGLMGEDKKPGMLKDFPRQIGKKFKQVPTIYLDTQEARDYAKGFYREQAQSGDRFAEFVLDTIDTMDKAAKHPMVQNSFYYYGDMGLYGPYLRTMVEGPAGGKDALIGHSIGGKNGDQVGFSAGKERISHFFITEEQAKKYAQETANVLAWAFAGNRKQVRLLARIMGSDPDKKSLNTLNDMVGSLVLEELLAPGQSQLSQFREEKANDEGGDPNTREEYPEEQYKGFHTNWFKTLTPGTKENDKNQDKLVEYIAKKIEENLVEYQKQGIDISAAADIALYQTATQGMGGFGGMITPTMMDTPEIHAYPGGMENGEFKKTNQIRKNLIAPSIQEHSGITRYDDYDADRVIKEMGLRSRRNQASLDADVFIRIADNLDHIGYYGAADFITKVMQRTADINPEDVADILGSGEEAPEGIPSFKAKHRPGLEEVTTRHPETGRPTIDFIDNADNVFKWLSDDPELVKEIQDIIYAKGRGPGETIAGPYSIRVPQNKSKFDVNLNRRIMSTPEQLLENRAKYWEHHAAMINDRYQRARESSEYWGGNSHNTDRDLMHVVALQKELETVKKRISVLKSLARELKGHKEPTDRNMIEQPYSAWDTESLAFFDPRAEGHDEDVQKRLLDIQREKIRNNFGDTQGMAGGLEEGEEEKLALPYTLLGGYELPKEDKQTEPEKELSGILQNKPHIRLPGALKTLYPGQTHGAEIYRRPKDKNGQPIRNRYPTYQGDQLRHFTS